MFKNKYQHVLNGQKEKIELPLQVWAFSLFDNKQENGVLFDLMTAREKWWD